eukprot:712831-Prorocentrum_minimum.AAC.1
MRELRVGVTLSSHRADRGACRRDVIVTPSGSSPFTVAAPPQPQGEWRKEGFVRAYSTRGMKTVRPARQLTTIGKSRFPRSNAPCAPRMVWRGRRGTGVTLSSHCSLYLGLAGVSYYTRDPNPPRNIKFMFIGAIIPKEVRLPHNVRQLVQQWHAEREGYGP